MTSFGPHDRNGSPIDSFELFPQDDSIAGLETAPLEPSLLQRAIGKISAVGARLKYMNSISAATKQDEAVYYAPPTLDPRGFESHFSLEEQEQVRNYIVSGKFLEDLRAAEAKRSK